MGPPHMTDGAHHRPRSSHSAQALPHAEVEAQSTQMCQSLCNLRFVLNRVVPLELPSHGLPNITLHEYLARRGKQIGHLGLIRVPTATCRGGEAAPCQRGRDECLDERASAGDGRQRLATWCARSPPSCYRCVADRKRPAAMCLCELLWLVCAVHAGSAWVAAALALRCQL